MPFIENMIFKVIFTIILLLLFFYVNIYYFLLLIYFAFGKELGSGGSRCLLSKPRNSKMALRLRGDSKSFEDGFINNTLG